MILRSGAVLFFLLALAADGETAARYLVATTAPAQANGFRAAVDGASRSVTPRSVAPFEAFDGFAATLTPDDVSALRASRGVRWIEPVVERNAFAAAPVNPQVTPWGISTLRVLESRPARLSGAVNVVVIDSGIDPSHEDLARSYAGGINILDPTQEPRDDASHGTHVAGTIVAADNAVGVVGIAPDARLWVAKTLDARGRGTSEGVIRALDWVLARKQENGGRWIINLSLGSPRPSALEREAVARVIADGIIVVAASGNSPYYIAPVSYPGAYPGVVSVGAIDSAASVPDFSNRGPEIDFAAPGVDVVSTLPEGFALESAIGWNDAAPFSRVMEFSGRGEVTAPLVACGVGRPEEFPADVAGKIAVIRRGGDLSFAEKAANAIAAGAAASIIANNVEEPEENLAWTLGRVFDPAPIVVAGSRSLGEAMLARGGVATVAVRHARYGLSSGTSMASPHVAGAIALLWSIAPDASPAQIYDALATTARDTDAEGFDERSGYGVPDVHAAARLLAPGAFDGRPQTGRRRGR